MKKTVLPIEIQNELLSGLELRFHKNMHRHKGLIWNDILEKLNTSAVKIHSLFEMESSGGEPDVIDYDKEMDEFLFVDCSVESPSGRRSLCYDREGLDSRKEHRPINSALDMAREMGVELLDETQYRNLQKFGQFDNKTSSWLKTPDNIRKLGGALFGDFRYESVFIYHNGAQSYYAARGFRAALKV